MSQDISTHNSVTRYIGLTLEKAQIMARWEWRALRTEEDAASPHVCDQCARTGQVTVVLREGKVVKATIA